MPYITESDKRMVEAVGPSTVGQLTYAFTKVAEQYRADVSAIGGDTYSLKAEILAAFEAAKLEFYRRVMAPYEDQKMAENGDVYA